MRSRLVALCLRGFELAPAQVESAIGRAATERGMKGEPVKKGVSTILTRSFVRYSVECQDSRGFDEMINLLLGHVGGVSHLCDVRDQVKPEFLQIDITLPIKGSEEQEGGFFSPAVLSDIAKLRAMLSFQFL